jgi:hypothetical protein
MAKGKKRKKKKNDLQNITNDLATQTPIKLG